ncbi:MAG: hypothetical protein A2896_00955 [Candidatus Nealsonbacteria bacterium RIFCSPLOWO2_01_FULL_43_32]|uniref:DDH domain-containing protein n=1 Tax=Candidatus Nealsonbacteria bacterium RIFCSPLOWO2_01_FULL_43_32 TaxID=1801672 RepID=A0A1G2EEG1_9BACT|nr:MAG: hypothetical protein A2896_00955 [Candidatus Nealsonbacteria bacterium RIFCSPLOWO2_01_FULL_43_32]
MLSLKDKMDALDQVKNLINESQNVLIAPGMLALGDSLSSALALLFTLRKLGKNANVLIDKIPENFQFLANLEPFSSKDFVISIDGSEKEIGEMRYEKNEKGLKIYLTLKQGKISQHDVAFSTLGQNPDLVIALGIKSAQELSAYHAPVLNIDNQPSNENFGEVNLIETTKSLAEISLNLIKALGPELIQGNVATCLLTGIICASRNFRNPETKPKTFETSAYLINQGADHQKIIQHLYKQKSIAQIKFLGRILEKLNFDKEKELYDVALTAADFQESNVHPKDLGFTIEELKFNFRYLPNLLILWESHASPVTIRGVFYSTKPGLVEKILENYEGVSRGEGVLFSTKESDLALVKEKILKIL